MMALTEGSRPEISRLLRELVLNQTEILKRLTAMESSQMHIQAQQESLSNQLQHAEAEVITKYRRYHSYKLDPASNRVVRVTELLEKIMLYLPLKDLLVRVQRVNKYFRSTIHGSIHLRRALFLEPDSSDGERRLNPLLMKARFLEKARFDPYRTPRPRDSIDYLFRIQGESYCEQRRIHGHVRLRYVEMRPRDDGRSYEVLIEFDQSFHNSLSMRLCHDCVDVVRQRLVAGSWRDMYVSQPPMSVSWRYGSGDYAAVKGKEHKVILEGQRAGNLFDTKVCRFESDTDDDL
jgi:hypothetical protein